MATRPCRLTRGSSSGAVMINGRNFVFRLQNSRSPLRQGIDFPATNRTSQAHGLDPVRRDALRIRAHCYLTNVEKLIAAAICTCAHVQNPCASPSGLRPPGLAEQIPRPKNKSNPNTMWLQITLGEERGSGHLYLAKNRTCHIPQWQPMRTGRPNEGQTRLTISEAIDNGLDDPMSQRRLRKRFRQA
jgi:hypothetical protein